MESNKTNGLIAAAIVGLAVLGCWSPTERPSEDTPTPRPSASSTPSNTNHMSNNSNTKTTATGFTANLPVGFKAPTDDAGRLLLKEYGAVFIARGGVTPPKTVVFKDQAEVTAFQNSLKTSSETIGGFNLELQAAAMDALRKAIDDAKAAGLSINPRDKDSAKRSYDETIELWNSRGDQALKQ
jgi:hypothetical protein